MPALCCCKMLLLRRACGRSRNTVGAAAIAGSAARGMFLSEIPPEAHASAFLGLGVIGDGAKPALPLMTKGLELRHQIVAAGLEDLGRCPDADATLRIALNEAGLLKVRQQHIANPHGY